MPARLDGRRALVTGAASGIGAEIARRFAAEGARVAALDLENLGVMLSKLSLAQADYIGVPVAGPFKPDHYRY